MQYKPFALFFLIQLTLIAFLGGCSSSEEQQANYLKRAQAQYDAGNLKKARIELKNVLQINRYNPPARYLQALINMDDANWRDAHKNLVLAIEYDPDFIDARIKLGGLYLSVFGSDENILEQADLVLAIDPGNADAHALRSSVFRRQRKDADAIKEAELGLNSVPGHVGASAALAAIYMKDDPELALSYINTSIAINPSDRAAKGIKLLLLTQQSNHDAAIAVFKELIADDPEDITYYRLLLDYLREQDRRDEADALLRNLATSPPDNVEIKVWLAQSLDRETLSDISESTIKGFIIEHPEEYELRFALTSLYLRSQRPTDADRVLREIIALDEDGADAQSARGTIATLAWGVDKDRAASEAMTDEILTIEDSNATALRLKATFKLIDGDSIGAITNLRTALKSDPTAVGIALMLGDAYTANNSVDLAVDAYRNALELSPNNATAVQKVSKILINQKDYTAADSILKDYLEQAPKNIEIRVLLIESYMLQQRWNDALASTQIIADQEGQLTRGIYLRGRVRYAQKEYPAAIGAFKEVLQIEPNAVEALSYLVNTLLVMEEVAAAEEYLSRHISAYPQQEHALELQGGVYLASGDPDAAIESYRAALTINPQQLSAQIALGRALQAEGDLVGSLQAYEDGLQLSPQNVGLLNLKAGLLEAMKRYQDAADIYNAVLAIDDGQAVASNNLAMLLVDHFPSDESYSRALQLTAEFEDSDIAALLDTRGWVYYQIQDYANAKRLLQRAVAADVDESVFRFHLGMTYYKLGDKDSAKIELEKSLANKQTFTGSDEASKLLQEL